MNRLVLSTRKYRAGYEIREELHRTDFKAVVINEGKSPPGAVDITEYINQHRGETVLIRSAYTPKGDYIGDKKVAHFLCFKRGIKPELSDPTHHACSIGFCKKEQKWYGWSHRAIYGFGVGDVVKEGDCCASSGWTDEYLAEHPEADISLPVGFTAKDLVDAKRMAIAFAQSVS